MARTKTTAEFIQEARQVHGDKYGYSLVDYKNSLTKLKITCQKHDVFLQRPNDHLNGFGCSQCSGLKRRTSEEFKTKANEIHGDKYDYSNVKYINNRVKVDIICNIHGTFKQSPESHIRGNGCSSCSGKNKKTTKDFIRESRGKHGDIYDYSSVKYNGSLNKVQIICREHGVFLQAAISHIKGAGCPSCSAYRGADGSRSNTKDFVRRANDVHKGKYDYSKVEYKNNRLKVKILCKAHGTFLQDPKSHLIGAGCPKCNASKGELKVESFLKAILIPYETQKRFNKCRGKRYSLPFDFYIPSFNLLIEYDGEQHFKTWDKIGGQKTLLMTQKYDQIKDEFAREHGYKLLRIPYTDFARIEDILAEHLQVGRVIQMEQPQQLALAI